MDWQEIAGGWTLVPSSPIGIVHFLGGAFVGTAPQIAYRSLLEPLVSRGYAVVAIPFLNTLDHSAIAREVLSRFETIVTRLQAQNRLRSYALPIYGLGHSLGCKLHLLIGSLFAVKRAGNILMAYNNYPLNRAIPFAEYLNFASQIEFTPSPARTTAIVSQDYQVRRNLLIQFANDDIDQTADLNQVLQSRFDRMVALQTLPGTHLTPLSQQSSWQAGANFTPFDAIAQWMNQETGRDFNLLKQEILRWLNPVAGY